MTLAPKAQAPNNLPRFLLTKHQRLSVPVVRFLPMTIADPMLKYYYKFGNSRFLK
jgi:hypothetical protein